MILVLERRLEGFSRLIETRLLSIEDQIIGARDTNKKSNYMSDKWFLFGFVVKSGGCFECQITEKDAIISFLSKQPIIINKFWKCFYCLDANQVLKGIRKSNIVKLVFGQLNINSLRNKFDTLSEMIKDFVDVFMTSETKLYDSFPGCQFFIEGYHTSSRFDQNGKGDGILLYIREDIPAKVIYCDFPTYESFYVEINLFKKNGC